MYSGGVFALVQLLFLALALAVLWLVVRSAVLSALRRHHQEVQGTYRLPGGRTDGGTDDGTDGGGR
jgi:hypothetical protein